MRKLGYHITHPDHGRGEVLGYSGRGENFRYVVKFRQPDGTWKSVLMTEAEANRKPWAAGKRGRRWARREPDESATEEEKRSCEGLGLTLEQLREARK